MPRISPTQPKVAVVVPCYRVKSHILDVLSRIGGEVEAVYVVDDACPEKSGAYVKDLTRDPRVLVIERDQNGGVGAATLTGAKRAVEDGATIIVKLDGDGQMDPAAISRLIDPIVRGEADYAKGNRFYNPRSLDRMPQARLIGNAALSFFTKLSSGYWDIFDPTNGYVAIHADVFRQLPLERVAQRYFFESDLLFRLNTLRAVVVDVPMTAHYGDETSNLLVGRAIPQFLSGNLKNFLKRVFYHYFLRDFSIGTVYLLMGLPLFLFGVIFGIWSWIDHAERNLIASAGTVMLAALPTIVGFQLLLAFLGYDIQSVPRRVLHRRLRAQSEFARRAAEASEAPNDPRTPSRTSP